MNWISMLGLEAFVARWRASLIEGAIAAEDRLELAHLEWQEQKRRLRYLLVLTILVAGLTVVALILLSLALMVQFWDTPQRILVAWLVAGGWLLLWGAAMWALVSMVRQAGSAFALTRRELLQDLALDLADLVFLHPGQLERAIADADQPVHLQADMGHGAADLAVLALADADGQPGIRALLAVQLDLHRGEILAINGHATAQRREGQVVGLPVHADAVAAQPAGRGQLQPPLQLTIIGQQQ